MYHTSRHTLIRTTLLAAAVTSMFSGITNRADAAAPTSPAAEAITDASAGEAPALDAINFGRASVFGYTPGTIVRANVVSASISRELGQPTSDTGWYHVPYTPNANRIERDLGNRDFRVLRWGDLSVSFTTNFGQRPMLWAWSVGDRRVNGYGNRLEPARPPRDGRSGLVTGKGIGVGSSYWEIQDVYEGRLTLDTLPGRDDSMWMYPHSDDAWPDRGAATSYFSLTIEGTVTGIGATTYMGHSCSC